VAELKIVWCCWAVLNVYFKSLRIDAVHFEGSNVLYNKVVRKVRKTEHQNHEFGHTQGEIFKNPAKKYICIQRGMKLRKPSILVVNWVSSCLFFFLGASTAATYIFTAPNCTTTIISLEPCALNAEYQHFTLTFIKMSLLCAYLWKRG
jgi:hypothetical protein